MGAGAGYEVKFDITTDVNSVGDIVKLIKDNLSFTFEGMYGTLRVDCKIPCRGKVCAESYYYGSHWVEGVDIIAKNIVLDWEEYNYSWLTTEFIDRIEEKFDNDIRNLSMSDYGSEITVDDIDIDELAYDIYTNLSLNTSIMVGGGWSHSTFTGEVDFADYDADGFHGLTLEILNKDVIDYIDLAVMGDNVTYTIRMDGDILDGADTEDEAIEMLKAEIDNAIANGEDIDLDYCFVDRDYWHLINAKGEVDYDDYSEVVYRASDDPDYADYV